MINLNDKKIIFFDIDGTIYLYEKGVIKETRDAIRKLRENGHIAMLCTGRTLSMIFPEILDIGFDGIIAGAGTNAWFNGKELYKYILPDSVTWNVINTMRECGIMAIPEGIRNIYFDCNIMPEDYFPIYKLYKKCVGENVVDINITKDVVASKVSGTANKNADIKRLFDKFKNEFTFVTHQKKYIEMIPNGYSKAVGIEKVINNLQIPWENTYAFGDSMNDYEMLKYVKYGVAMGNSTPEFKNEMKYVTEDFDKGGIKNALERFGLI